MHLILALLLTALAAPPATPDPSAPVPTAAAVPEVEVVVDAGGYAPSTVHLPAGRPVRLAFLKKDWSGCTREVVIPHAGLRVSLPTGERVVVDLPAQTPGTYVFHCGMNMVKGSLVIDPPAPAQP